MSWDERIADMARKINLYVPICPTEGTSVSLYRDYTKPEKRNCEATVGESRNTAPMNPF